MGRKPKVPRVEPPSTVTGTDPTMEKMENKQHMETPGNKPAKNKATKSMKVFVRRSGRLRNLSLQMPNNETVPGEVDLVDSERQDEPHVEELSNVPKEPHIEELNAEPISSQGDLEEKTGFVEPVQEFKSMVTKITFPSEPQYVDIDYKSLYIDSQKKIDSLVDENYELAKKLEFARGKVEAYEQMKDAIGNFKDMRHLSSTLNVDEALLLNILSQAGAARCNLPAIGSPAAGSPAAVANNDNLLAVASPTAANGDEPKASPEKNKRGRKKSRS